MKKNMRSGKGASVTFQMDSTIGGASVRYDIHSTIVAVPVLLRR